MAHEIEIRNGKASMFYAGQTPWHNLGTAVDTEQTAESAIKLAGLDWEIEKQKMFLENGQAIPEKMAIVRSEDNTVLGVVGNKYQPITNAECFDFMDSIIGEGRAVYHTAGSLFGGKRIFLTIKLPNDIKIGPDTVEKYILLTTSHDGSLAIQVKNTPIRVVCANTLSVSLSQNRKDKFSIRHTRNYKEKVNLARQALGLVEAYYQRAAIEFGKLLNKPFTGAQMKSFVETLIPVNNEDINAISDFDRLLNRTPDKKTLSTRKENIRNEIELLFTKGKGAEPVKNTRWAAWNAVTEYVDHHRSSKVSQGKEANDTRFNSILFNSGHQLRNQAFQLLKD